ncbi:MAG TPA: hypothetical protein VFZ65_14530 [Planctomycetota bacterium]|nr:hypothetical protein [Planctomycetota bacterium]
MHPALPTSVLVLAAAAPCQLLDDLRDAVREAARSTRFALSTATFVGLTEESLLSGGRFRIDGTPSSDLSVLTLPLQRELDLGERLPHLLVEGTLGYASSRQDFANIWDGLSPAFATRMVARFEALGGFVGAGPLLPIGDGWQVAVLGVGGVAYVDTNARYEGPGAAFSAAVLDGIAVNWDATYAIYGGGLLLRNEGWRWGSTAVTPQLRYDLRRVDPIRVDDVVQDEANTVQWLAAQVGFEGSTGWSISGREVQWTSSLGGKVFDHAAAQVLGVGGYGEVGAGLRWRAEQMLPGLSHVELRGALFYGDGIQGWTLGLSVSF